VYQAPASLSSYDPDGTRPSPVPIDLLDGLFCPKLNQFRRELGLASVTHVCDRWMHSPHQGIALFPDWFAGQPSLPDHVLAAGSPFFDQTPDATTTSRFEAFLASGPRPVVFVCGSEERHAASFFTTSVMACIAAKRRAIQLTRRRDQIPAILPASILHLEYVPLEHLLPRSALLVHHGGIGTCAQALRAGIPQLITPSAFDQSDNAARVVSLGVGLSVKRSMYSVVALVRLLSLLAQDAGIRERCASIAQRLKGMNAVERICRFVETLS